MLCVPALCGDMHKTSLQNTVNKLSKLTSTLVTAVQVAVPITSVLVQAQHAASDFSAWVAYSPQCHDVGGTAC